LNEQTKTNTDGIYRIDLSKVKDKKKGYRSVVRFLPNLTQDGKGVRLNINWDDCDEILNFLNYFF
jgi:hypothetical protein